MYRPDEIKLLLRIRELLYDRRYTIAGARRTLLDERKDSAPQVEIGFDDAARKLALHEVKTELRQIAERLRNRDSVGRG
jgi:DNA-binding transcriptional MerR regulator